MAYARVRFLDEGIKQRVVPVSFIKDLNNVLDTRKKYLVFWSNEKEDTPQTLLEKQSDIPIVRNGDISVSAGYYEATVSVIKDSLEELLNHKRTTTPTSKIIHGSSFEVAPGDKNSNRVNSKKPAASNSKPAEKSQSKSRARSSSRATKSKGTNPNSANYILARLKKEETTSTATGSCGSEKSDSEDGFKLPLVIKHQQSKAKKRALVDFSTSDSDSAPSKKWKNKADPPYSPSKHFRLKEDYEILQMEIKRVRELNYTLQDKRNRAEEESSAAEFRYQQLVLAVSSCMKCSNFVMHHKPPPSRSSSDESSLLSKETVAPVTLCEAVLGQ